MQLGPVEYAVVEFPGGRMNGRIVRALADLIERRVIRLIDLVFIRKEPDGSVRSLEIDALPTDEAAPFADLDGEIGGLLSEDDIAEAAARLAPDTSAAVLLWEDSWAASLAEAVRASEGRLVVRETVPSPVVEAAVRARA